VNLIDDFGGRKDFFLAFCGARSKLVPHLCIDSAVLKLAFNSVCGCVENHKSVSHDNVIRPFVIMRM